VAKRPRARDDASKPGGAAPAVLIVLAFMSSGAFLVTNLPPAPVSRALNLVALAAWLLAFGAGIVAYVRPEKRVLWGIGAVAASVALSFLAGGAWFQAAFYDLFGAMPLVQWLAFPVVFLLAAGMAWAGSRLEAGLSVVAGLGTVLAVVLAIQQVTTNSSHVFGTTGYSITALIVVIPLALGLAVRASGRARWAWLAAASAAAVSLGVLSRATTGEVAVPFAVLAVAAGLTLALRPERRALRVAGIAAAAAATAMAGVLLLAQVPALTGSVVTPERIQPYGGNLAARVYLWRGAQAMFADKPLLGFGPSGYRVRAAEYLDPMALQYGSDVAGNADPTVYSPQSPHSLVWEVGTRLGLVGLVAFGFLLFAWGAAVLVRMKARDGTEILRASLAVAFLSALFALQVNPVHFAFGLFAAVAAGLAVAPTRASDSVAVGKWVKRALVVAGVLVLVVAAWLFAGDWSGRSAPGDFAQRVAGYEAALRTTPGQPTVERQLLEARLLMAADDAALRAAQTAVDSAPAFQRDFAPGLVSFAAFSLAQAERTGRTDVAWERLQLERAAAVLPPIPSLVAEQLHLAVVARDTAAIETAMEPARKWGVPYPYTKAYLEAAEKLLAEQ